MGRTSRSSRRLCSGASIGRCQSLIWWTLVTYNDIEVAGVVEPGTCRGPDRGRSAPGDAHDRPVEPLSAPYGRAPRCGTPRGPVVRATDAGEPAPLARPQYGPAGHDGRSPTPTHRRPPARASLRGRRSLRGRFTPHRRRRRVPGARANRPKNTGVEPQTAPSCTKENGPNLPRTAEKCLGKASTDLPRAE